MFLLGQMIILLFICVFPSLAFSTQGPDNHSHCPPSKTILVKKVIPPKENPYPVQSAQDHQRVNFAQKAIQVFWQQNMDQSLLQNLIKSPHDPKYDDQTKAPIAFDFQNKSITCVEELACWSKDYPFLKSIMGIQSHVFKYPKISYLHVVPWSMKHFEQRKLPIKDQNLKEPLQILEAQKADYAKTDEPLAFSYVIPEIKADEYLVDAIVQFPGDKGWFHLLVVMSEDDKGNIFLRRFILNPIQDLTKQSIYC